MIRPEEARRLVEEALPSCVPEEGEVPILRQAMRYSLLSGGKRFRPVLTLLAADLLDVPPEQALPAACAVEMVHTYSLIHDDLPAMDGDLLRRGRPTCHVVYGEGMALLAGDALLTHAFFVLASAADRYPERAAGVLRAVGHLGRLGGLGGMCAGQALDLGGGSLAPERRTEEALDVLQRNKTAALIQAALLCGLELGDPEGWQREAVSECGLHLGLAFQAADDLLDVSSTPERLGKTPGKDIRQGKFTRLSLGTPEEAQGFLGRQTALALQALRPFGPRGDVLKGLAEAMQNRKR